MCLKHDLNIGKKKYIDQYLELNYYSVYNHWWDRHTDEHAAIL